MPIPVTRNIRVRSELPRRNNRIRVPSELIGEVMWRDQGARLPEPCHDPVFPVNLVTSLRNKALFTEWNRHRGRATLRRLARQFDLSERAVYNIIRDERRRRASCDYNLVHIRLQDGSVVDVIEPLDNPPLPPLDREEHPKTRAKRRREAAIRRGRAGQDA